MRRTGEKKEREMEKVGNEGDHEKRQKAGKEMGGKTGLCK